MEGRNAQTQTHGHHFTFENFHLDPQDYQNFLLINPPLTEYSGYLGGTSVPMTPVQSVQSVQSQVQTQVPTQVPMVPSVSQVGTQVGAPTGATTGVVDNDLLGLDLVMADMVGSNDLSSGQVDDFINLPEETPHLPTRRLSISNGQIGQISMMVHSQMQAPTPNDENISVNSAPTYGFDIDINGIPKRPLIYNNEVIFNPNDPIPGTSAWKRAKVLERNRIAASKCRAKKKNLQLKLEKDVTRLEEENKLAHSMLNLLRERILNYCDRVGVNVEEVIGGIPTTIDTPNSVSEGEYKIKSETPDSGLSGGKIKTEVEDLGIAFDKAISSNDNRGKSSASASKQNTGGVSGVGGGDDHVSSSVLEFIKKGTL